MRRSLLRFVLSVVLSFFAISIPATASFIELPSESDLFVDPTEATLPKTELLQREFMKAKNAFAAKFFAEARLSIEKIKEIARTHHLTTPINLPALQRSCAVGRMRQLEGDITDAFHDGDTPLVLQYGKEALDIAKQENVIIPKRIIQIVNKITKGYAEPVYRQREKAKRHIFT